jgi:hypothetical protein
MHVRISQLADFRSPAFGSAWDCAVPSNLNDSDLRSGMEASPLESNQATNAIFAVVRAELWACAKSENVKFDIEDTYETKYLKYCDSSNPLHFMTVWSTRSLLAKFRLFDFYTRTPTLSIQSGTELALADLNSIRLLECDTKTVTSPMTKPYMWLVNLHCPGPAYVHLLKSLGKRPRNTNANGAWQVLSEHFEGCTFPTLMDLTISVAGNVVPRVH